VKRLPLGGTEDFSNFAPETERYVKLQSAVVISQVILQEK